MGDDGGQWEGECGRRSGVGGQRDDKEAGGCLIGMGKEEGVTVIGIRDGNDRRKGGDQRSDKGFG